MDLVWTDATGSSVSLSDRAPFSVLRGAQGLDALPVDNLWEPRISFSGSALSQRREPVRPLLLPMLVQSETPQVEVRNLLSTLQRSPGTLTATVDGVTRQLLEVSYESSTDVRDAQNALPTLRKLGVQLTAGDPWWYGDTRSQFLAIGGETTFDNAGVTFDDVGTPFDGGDSVVIPVVGDTFSFPTFYVTGPFTALTVSDSTSGLAFQLAGALASGAQVVVDTRPGHRGPRLATASAPDWSLLTAASRLWTLPTPQTSIAVSAAGDDANSRVEVRWRPRWATP